MVMLIAFISWIIELPTRLTLPRSPNRADLLEILFSATFYPRPVHIHFQRLSICCPFCVSICPSSSYHFIVHFGWCVRRYVDTRKAENSNGIVFRLIEQGICLRNARLLLFQNAAAAAAAVAFHFLWQTMAADWKSFPQFLLCYGRRSIVSFTTIETVSAAIVRLKCTEKPSNIASKIK